MSPSADGAAPDGAAAPARIRPLSAVLANQIAAGEVVERPASVVKELVENALDAEATKIGVELETGGTRLIRVRDDGFGIPSGELVLALSRHATSKIASLDDLDRIASMGFRGEALPSIASVSRLTLESRLRDAASGARVRVDGGGGVGGGAAASKAGTTVEVRDLFFNVPSPPQVPANPPHRAPARRRRGAPARPRAPRRLAHAPPRCSPGAGGDPPDGACPPSFAPVGEEFAANALDISFEAGDLSLHGFLAPPGMARTRPDFQFLFVNRRSVRDDVVRHAVRVGFGDSLAGAGYPAFVLHLGIDPAAVDVNVHPTKHEVRFRESRHVHDFVRHTVSRGLGGFATHIPPPEAAALALEAGIPLPEAAASPEAPVRSPGTAAPAPGVAAPAHHAIGGARPGTGRARPGGDRVGDHLAAYSALSAASRPTEPGAALGRVRLGGYVLVEGRGELLLIDLGAGRRALVRDRLDEAMRKDAPVSRPLLIPHTRTVPEATADAVDEAGSSLRSLGIGVRRGAPGVVTLRAIPTCLAGIDAEKLFDAVVEWAKPSRPVTDLAEALAALAGSAPFDGDAGDVIDAALGGGSAPGPSPWTRRCSAGSSPWRRRGDDRRQPVSARPRRFEPTCRRDARSRTPEATQGGHEHDAPRLRRRSGRGSGGVPDGANGGPARPRPRRSLQRAAPTES